MSPVSLSSCRELWRNERGQDLIEYALMVACMALAAGVVIPPLEGSFSTLYSKLASVLHKFGG